MSKIHVVQIAITTDPDGNQYSEYLDNMGRVWYDGGALIVDEAKSLRNEAGDLTKSVYKWVSDWKQVDLPEEPPVA